MKEIMQDACKYTVNEVWKKMKVSCGAISMESRANFTKPNTGQICQYNMPPYWAHGWEGGTFYSTWEEGIAIGIVS
jgi:hypothetical protein